MATPRILIASKMGCGYQKSRNCWLGIVFDDVIVAAAVVVVVVDIVVVAVRVL